MHENGGRRVLPTWAGGVARPHERNKEYIDWEFALVAPLIPPELENIWRIPSDAENKESPTPIVGSDQTNGHSDADEMPNLPYKVVVPQSLQGEYQF